MKIERITVDTNQAISHAAADKIKRDAYNIMSNDAVIFNSNRERQEQKKENESKRDETEQGESESLNKEADKLLADNSTEVHKIIDILA